MDILIIEDCPNTRTVLARAFHRNGLSVGLVAHGRAAFHLLNGMQDLPRLILCDIVMPAMDGLTFRFFQMRHPRLQQIPVILMSGHPQFRDFAKLLQVDDFVEKPFDQLVLLEIVGRYCALKRSKYAPLALYHPSC